MSRVIGVCQIDCTSIWNVLVGSLAIVLVALVTTGSLGLTSDGKSFMRHYWPPFAIAIVLWVIVTITTFVLREKQGMSEQAPEPEPESPPPGDDRRIQVVGDNTTAVSANTITSEGGPQHFGPKYEDASLGTLMRGAMGLDLAAIGQVARMQGALVNAAQPGITFDYDSQGNVNATIDGSKVSAKVTLRVKDPSKIVPGGDIDAAIRDADTVTFPKEHLANAQILINGADVTSELPFDTVTFKPLPFNKATSCFLTVEGTDARIDNLVLEAFKLEGGVVQITNKNQTDQPLTFTARAEIRPPGDRTPVKRLDGEFVSSFQFDAAKARYVRQVLDYHAFMDALTESRRMLIRETTTGELRYILRNTPTIADEDEGQQRLVHALRCAQQAAGMQDLRLPQGVFDDQTTNDLEMIDTIVTMGKFTVPLEAVQPPTGIGIPRPFVEGMLQHSQNVIQFPLIRAKDRHLVDLLGTEIDLGESYVLMPPLGRAIPMDQIAAKLAADPDAEEIMIPWMTLHDDTPKLVTLYYPQFLPPDWQKEPEAEYTWRLKEAERRRQALRNTTVTLMGTAKPPSVFDVEDRAAG